MSLYGRFTGHNSVNFPKQEQKSHNITLYGKEGGANVHGVAFQTVTLANLESQGFYVCFTG